MGRLSGLADISPSIYEDVSQNPRGGTQAAMVQKRGPYLRDFTERESRQALYARVCLVPSPTSVTTDNPCPFFSKMKIPPLPWLLLPRRRNSPSISQSCNRAAVSAFELLDTPWPVLLEQPRQCPVGQQPAAGLTSRTIVRLVCGIANSLHRRAAHGARLTKTPMDRHLFSKGSHLLRESLTGFPSQSVDPFR